MGFLVFVGVHFKNLRFASEHLLSIVYAYVTLGGFARVSASMKTGQGLTTSLPLALDITSLVVTVSTGKLVEDCSLASCRQLMVMQWNAGAWSGSATQRKMGCCRYCYRR